MERETEGFSKVTGTERTQNHATVYRGPGYSECIDDLTVIQNPAIEEIGSIQRYLKLNRRIALSGSIGRSLMAIV